MEKKKNLQSVPVIAKLFDISDRHVQRLAAGGVLPYESQRPYKFDLLPTIRAYIRYLRNRIDEHEKDERFEQAEYDKLRADADLKQHQAAIFRMKVRRMESQYHDAEVVKDCYNDFKLTIQEKIEQLPELLAEDLIKLETTTERSERIKKECFRILNELADYEYDPEAAEQRRKDHGIE